jgi:hypothetical protein
METAEIIKLLPTLSIEDRLTIANIALNSIEIETEEHTDLEPQLDRQLRMAANLAVDDYRNDRELTIFTSLDGEEFLG